MSFYRAALPILGLGILFGLSGLGILVGILPKPARYGLLIPVGLLIAGAMLVVPVVQGIVEYRRGRTGAGRSRPKA